MRYIKPDNIEPQKIKSLLENGRSLFITLVSTFALQPVLEDLRFIPYNGVIKVHNLSRGWTEYVTIEEAVDWIMDLKTKGRIKTIEIVR